MGVVAQQPHPDPNYAPHTAAPRASDDAFDCEASRGACAMSPEEIR
jgi:hypothetical protein